MLLPSCFVIIPLVGLDNVYKRIQTAWKTVFGKKAKVFNQNDDSNKGGRELIDTKILKNIRNSTAVVAVLSMGTKERDLYNTIDEKDRAKTFEKVFPFNVNVALETGYAMRSIDGGESILREYFLIADDTDKVTAFKFATDHFFDLAHRDITPYSESNLDELERDLVKHFTDFKKRVGL